MKQKTALLLAVFALLAGTGFAQVKPSKLNPKRTPTADSIRAAKDSVLEKLKGSTRHEGLFTLYQDTITGSILLYVKKDQLGKEFIYQSFSMGGPAELFLNQNMIRETWVFGVRKRFERLEFTRANTGFYFDPRNALSRAANVDVAETVFFTDKIAMKDSTGFYINADGLFLSDKLDRVKPNYPPTIPPQQYFNLGQLNPSKSIYNKVRSFPKNTDVLVELAYDNPAPANEGGRDITDARYVTVRMQHSFLAMPENDYQPRFDDPRVGYFTQEVNDMTTTNPTNYRDLINRWHLKKKDPTAAVSEPVEPIVWWVENTTPVELRQTIVDAGNKWNEAFEKAGFKNAVVMKIMPDNADWDPADIRYNVIRFVSSDLGFAIGPSFVNPRTGQILGADITIDYGLIRGGVEEQTLYSAFAPPSSRPLPGKHWQHCGISKGLTADFSMGRTLAELDENAGDSEQKLLKQFLTMLVLHEMGHTMGLNHNMKASQLWSPEELNNTTLTGQKGVMASVMDYDMVNASLDRSRQGDYYTTRTGPYDWWAIQYGYSAFPSAEEAKGLEAILSRSTEREHQFGNDADIASYGSGIDPRVQVWDMSSDMVAYGADRFQLVNNMMAKLKDRFGTGNQSYQTMMSKYYGLYWQRFSAAQAISRYIGGVYVDRSFAAQQATAKPFEPVSAAYQQKAMQTLGLHIFAPDAFAADAYLFPYMQQQRRGFNFFGRPEDPKPEQLVFNLQSSVLRYLLFPATLKRINSSTLYGNTYATADVLRDLMGQLFDADLKTGVNLYRQNIQTEFVNRLIAMQSSAEHDGPSKAAALHTLQLLRTRLKGAATTDEQTRAHRMALTFLIDKALVVK
jgi:hypothetical protein